MYSHIHFEVGWCLITFLSQPLTSRKGAPVTHCMGARAGLHTVWRNRLPAENRTPVIQPVVSHFKTETTKPIPCVGMSV